MHYSNQRAFDYQFSTLGNCEQLISAYDVSIVADAVIGSIIYEAKFHCRKYGGLHYLPKKDNAKTLNNKVWQKRLLEIGEQFIRYKIIILNSCYQKLVVIVNFATHIPYFQKIVELLDMANMVEIRYVPEIVPLSY